MIPHVRRPSRTVAVTLAVAALALAGCGGESPGQSAARAACTAYANTGRHQVATTADQADSERARALSQADRAASADPGWKPLHRDIADFFFRQRGLSQEQQAAVGEVDGYFAADRRVQADCTAAGEDIGPLRP